MKKLLLSLGTAAAIAAPVTAVVACSDVADPKLITISATTKKQEIVDYIKTNAGKEVLITVGTGESAVTTKYSVPYHPVFKETITGNIASVDLAGINEVLKTESPKLLDTASIYKVWLPQSPVGGAEAATFATKVFTAIDGSNQTTITYTAATKQVKAYYTVTTLGNLTGTKVVKKYDQSSNTFIINKDSEGEVDPISITTTTKVESLADLVGAFTSKNQSYMSEFVAKLISNNTK